MKIRPTACMVTASARHLGSRGGTREEKQKVESRQACSAVIYRSLVDRCERFIVFLDFGVVSMLQRVLF